MEISKRQNIILCNLLFVGLTACSSNAPSWNDEDSSRTSKRDADATNVVKDKFVEEQLEAPEESSDAMIVLPERESMFEIDPILTNPNEDVSNSASPMDEEKQSSNFAEAEPRASDANLEIMSAPASAYVVQAYAGKKLVNVTDYVHSHGLDDMQIVKTERDGEIFHVLISVHADRASAQQAASDLEQRTGSKPWLRSVTGLQRIIVQ